MISTYNLYAINTFFASSSGPILGVVLALITLAGTIATCLVTVHKARTEAKIALAQMTTEQKKSDIQMTQEIMSQTVVFLDDRLKIEREDHSREIAELRAEHDKEIAEMKASHARDIDRLEKRIDRVKTDHDSCKARNKELLEENELLRNGGHKNGA